MKPIQAAKYVSLLLIALMLGRASAGVNASARLGVDLDLTSAAIDGGRHFPLNTEFDVNLVGENASDLHAVNFDLTYDPTLLSPVKVDNKWVREGPFLKANASGAQTVFLVDKQDSRINVSTAILGTQPGVDGNGVVAHVRFKTIASGASVLQLTNVIFVDHLNNKDDITANAVSGHVWGYGPATRFQVSVPVESTVGVQVTVRFTAQDAAGVTNPDFTGTVQLTSSDPLAVLPPTIAFTGQDNGVKSAPAVFRRVGAQTVTGADTVNPAISGTSNSTLVRSRNAGARLLVDADSGTQGVQGDRQVTNGEVLDIAVLAGAMGDLHGVNFELGYDALKLQLVEVGGKPAAEGPFLGTNASGASTTFLTASAAGSVNVSTSILGNVAGVSGDGVIALVRFKAISEGVASLQLRQVASTDQFGNQDMLDANSLGGSLIIGQPPADIVATRLLVSPPAQVAVGDTFNLTLTAIDDLGRTDTDYAGTVTLTTTDTSSTVPGSVTFAPADRGFKTLRVAFNTIGPQTVTAVDTSAGLAGTSTAAQVVGVNRNASTALDLEPATASPDASRLVLKNQAFDVAVELTNCRDVRGVNLDVLFDPALLQPLEVGGKSAQEGLFLSQAGSTAFLATIQGSVLNISTSLLGSGPGVDGAGRLATVRFKAIGVGVSSVRLANVILVDHFGNRDDISATASQTTLRITAATRLRVDCPGTATVGQPS